MVFTAIKDNAAIDIPLKMAKDFIAQGYTITTSLSYTLDSDEIDQLLNGASLSISEVTFLSTEARATKTLDTYTVINNSEAVGALPNLENSALKSVFAALALNTSAVQIASTESEAVSIANDIASINTGVSTMSLSSSDNTSDSLGSTVIVSEEPLILRRVVPWKDVYNALNQQQNA